MSHLKPDDLERFRDLLTARSQALRVELLAHDGAQAREPVENVRDEAEDRRGDEVRAAERLRDETELRESEAALARLEIGRFGSCIECDVRIPSARLEAQPSAARCIACQERLESSLA
ncbi:MAG: TraR/DksA family transcriptional regulator [Burkholderiaceae bacterium]